MSSEEPKLPVINLEKPLTGNISFNLIKTKENQNKTMYKISKKLNNTSFSL